jgi:hypothetical protein
MMKKRGALNWLRSQDKVVYASGVSNLLGRYKNCVRVKGDYREKE